MLLGYPLLMLAGCATLNTPQITELVWPEPPQAPRIKFVGLLRNQSDLGRTTGEWFSEALLGPRQLPESLRQPMGVACSNDGRRLYVTDYAAPGVFVFNFDTQRMSPFGVDPFLFKTPLGVAVDGQDRVYVVDSSPKIIRVFDAQGRLLRVITHESLERPTGIAIDGSHARLYVADSASTQSDNHVVRVFDLMGNLLTAIGTQGSESGQFFFPTYLALDHEGNLYVTDTMNARIQVFDPGGRYLKTIGERGDAFGMFDKPKGVAVDGFGNVYVVDSGWSNVQIFNQQGQVLLFFGGRGRFPGLLSNPTGIAVDKTNRIYVADAFNGRVCIYQLVNTTAQDSLASSAGTGSAPPAPAPEDKEGGR